MIRAMKKIKWNEVIREYQRANWMFKKDLSEEVIFKVQRAYKNKPSMQNSGENLTLGRGNSHIEGRVSLICCRI